MLAVILAQLLFASGSCQSKCATEANKCYSSCGTRQGCTNRCDDRVASCNAGCANEHAKAREARNKALDSPCPTTPRKQGDKDQLRPCTDEEAKRFKEALESQQLKQALKCKDARGNPAPCKDDEALSEELMKAGGGEDAVCVDANGQPTLCPEAKKAVEAQAKSHAKKQPR